MQPQLKDKVALVTGAGRGIGRAISLALASQGATLLLAARSAQNLDHLAEQIKKHGTSARAIPTDLTSEASIKNLIRVTGEKLGRLDILVNNAGVTHSQSLEQTSTADWDHCFQVNARAPFILCREALPLLKKSLFAHIVNIGSVVSIKGYPRQSAYTASKHALRGMTMSLAEELKDSSIRVHSICSGGVDTAMARIVRPDIRQEDLIAPEEIAELVAYLVTHRGSGIIDEIHIRRASSSPWF